MSDKEDIAISIIRMEKLLTGVTSKMEESVNNNAAKFIFHLNESSRFFTDVNFFLCVFFSLCH